MINKDTHAQLAILLPAPMTEAMSKHELRQGIERLVNNNLQPALDHIRHQADSRLGIVGTDSFEEVFVSVHYMLANAIFKAAQQSLDHHMAARELATSVVTYLLLRKIDWTRHLSSISCSVDMAVAEEALRGQRLTSRYESGKIFTVRLDGIDFSEGRVRAKPMKDDYFEVRMDRDLGPERVKAEQQQVAKGGHGTEMSPEKIKEHALRAIDRIKKSGFLRPHVK